VKATSVLKPVKLTLTMETPEERGAMNLEGFKRDKKDMEGSGEYSPFKKGGSVKSSSSAKWAKLKQLSLLWVVHQNVLTVLQCVARLVERWCNHGRKRKYSKISCL
jgi:hypothetical protein